MCDFNSNNLFYFFLSNRNYEMNKNYQQIRAAQQKLLKDKQSNEISVLKKAFTRCSQWDDKVKKC